MIKITLSENEKKELSDSLLRFNKDLVTRKARVILYLSNGGRITNAMEAFNLSRPTIYRYVREFECKGVESLLNIKPIPGRPSRLPDNIGEIIIDALKRSPAAIECLDTSVHNWTLELMRDYLTRAHNINICLSYIGYLMDKFRIRHIYSRAIMTSPDPQYNEKRQVVQTLKKKWKPARSKKVRG